MLPKVVDYFYAVEAALASGDSAASFGFVDEQVSVEEILVRRSYFFNFSEISQSD
jgi:hypothetical protein